jgi:hypothetical protein
MYIEAVPTFLESHWGNMRHVSYFQYPVEDASPYSADRVAGISSTIQLRSGC